MLESEMAAAVKRKMSLEQSLHECDRFEIIDSLQVDDVDISNRLGRLGEVLGNTNPCLAHLELSLHVDRIDCFPDGTVRARFCKLGSGGIELIDTIESLEVRTGDPIEWSKKCKPRRRARIHVTSESHEPFELDALSFWASDPRRFDELGDNWFEVVNFTVPEPTYWAKENAIAVSEMRLSGLTHEQLADHFSVSIPTVRKALRIGKTLDAKYSKAPRKMARARWHEDNAELVFKTSRAMMMKEMVKHFGKSDVTLRKAIVHAQDVLGLA